MTTSNIVVISIAAVLAVAWVPVGVHFWRSWKNRGSPLSLAILALIGYPIFINASTAIFLTEAEITTLLILIGTNLLLLLNFVMCFRWQKERFPNARSNTSPKPRSDPPDFWHQGPNGLEEHPEIGEEDPTPKR